MADIETLRLFVNERLTAVAEDILAVFVRTMVQYQHHLDLQRRQLDLMNTSVKAHVSVDPVCKDEVYPGPQDRSLNLVQEEQESPQIKEQELLQRPAEAEGSSLTLLAVKTEDGEENSETELLASTSAEHMKTQAHVEDCGASQPTSDVQLISSHRSESDTEDSDVWEETREDPTAVNTMHSHKTQHVEGQRSCMSNSLSQDLTSKHAPYICSPALDTPFMCKICGKIFGKKHSLKAHMMTHTGEKPFGCTVCGKLFNHSGSVTRHMLIHTGEKRFSCTVCGKGFGLNCNLKTHMRSHTGEKPFSCVICGKGFAVFANLKSHMRTHRGNVYVNRDPVGF